MAYVDGAGQAIDRFRILFENSSDAHLIYDETGTTDCNDATIKLLKANDKAHVLSVHPAALAPEYQPDGRRSMEKAREMEALARANGYHRFEWQHLKLDGESFPVEVTLNPVEIAGKPAMIVVWHDLTETKRIEAELRQHGEELESLNRELKMTNARLRRDLQAAARIQQALLPAALPDTPPVRLAWTFRPCEELAGDLLNIFPLDDRRVGLYLLDVSGHGVAASLLSVTVSHLLSPHGESSLLRSPRERGPLGRLASPSEVLHRVNARICPDGSEQFLTLFYGILDCESCVLRYANAAHPGPVIFTGGKVVTLEHSGFPVGVAEEAEYEDAEAALQPGDRFWLYSDGLVEAMNSDGEQWGKERFIAAAQAAALAELNDAVRGVLRDAETWAGDRGPQDDISLVAFEIGRC